MRTYLWTAAAMLLLAVPASTFAEDEVKPEQLKKMYDDALAQLKSAQDRKAELAKENEALAAKVHELQKQLTSAQEQVQTLKREVSDNADRTYFLRAYHAAWEHFLNRYPELMARWKVYLGHSALTFSAEFPDLPMLDLSDLKPGDERNKDNSDVTHSDSIERAEASGERQP